MLTTRDPFKKVCTLQLLTPHDCEANNMIKGLSCQSVLAGNQLLQGLDTPVTIVTGAIEADDQVLEEGPWSDLTKSLVCLDLVRCSGCEIALVHLNITYVKNSVVRLVEKKVEERPSQNMYRSWI